MCKVLVINPGSTSTKIGAFDNGILKREHVVRHNGVNKERGWTKAQAMNHRKETTINELKEHGWFDVKYDAIMARGGLLKPITSGVYQINEKMLLELSHQRFGEHASNLGAIIANEIASLLDVPHAFIMDPIVVDEMHDVARVSGYHGVERRSVFHALNQKAVARRFYRESGQTYENSRAIVVHMGGGVSVGAHVCGRVIDVNNAVNGEGPFSPERSGTLPMVDVIDMCYSGLYEKDDVMKKIVGEGGMKSYFGTHDVQAIENMMHAGDEKAKRIIEAFIYQVAKEIGAIATVLSGQVDAILLTGGIAYSTFITEEISKRVQFIAPIVIYPGEDEMQTLAEGATRVLLGKETSKVYE
jgi:butyrate kinase